MNVDGLRDLALQSKTLSNEDKSDALVKFVEDNFPGNRKGFNEIKRFAADSIDLPWHKVLRMNAHEVIEALANYFSNEPTEKKPVKKKTAVAPTPVVEVAEDVAKPARTPAKTKKSPVKAAAKVKENQPGDPGWEFMYDELKKFNEKIDETNKQVRILNSLLKESHTDLRGQVEDVLVAVSKISETLAAYEDSETSTE